MNETRRVLGLFVGALLLAHDPSAVAGTKITVANATSSATQNAGMLKEIIVTAQRRTQPLLKVPLAVTAITGNELQRIGITNSSQLSDLAPNLQVNSAFGDVQPNFTIRGIGVANEHNPNQASPIGVYVDGAYVAARVAQGLQLFDLSRIEILRGPQGTLYGQNTTGGAINFISRMPKLRGDNGYVQVGYGNLETFTSTGAFETTFKQNVAGMRLSYNYAHGNGYEQNVFPGQPNGNSTDSFAVRGIFRYRPTKRLNMWLKLTEGNANPTQAGVYDLGLGQNGANTVLDYSRVAHGLGFWQIDSNRLGRNYVRSDGAQFVLDYSLTGRWAITNLTSYDHAGASFTQEGTGVNSPILQQPLDTLYGNRFMWMNQEDRISYSSAWTHFQGGVYYGYDRDNSNSYYWLLDGAADVHQVYSQVRTSYAAFAQLDQHVTHSVSVTLGARITKDKSSYEDYSSYLEPGSVSYTGQRSTGAQYWVPSSGVFFLGSYNASAGRIESGPTLTLRSARPSFRGAVKYSFSSGQIVYASFSTGYRAAAFCGQCFLQSTIDVTKPETDKDYEVGTKGFYFHHKLSVAADAFWTDYRNQQINEQIGLQTILKNVPKSRMRGLELEIRAQPIPVLRLGLSAGYLDASFQQLTLAYAVVNGLQEPYAPKWTVAGRAAWRIMKIGDGSLSLNPIVMYTSNTFFSPYDSLNGNGPLSQPANTKINASLVYNTDKYTISAWVENLTNRQTFGDGLDLRASFGFYYLVPLAPRTFGVSVRYRF